MSMRTAWTVATAIVLACAFPPFLIDLTGRMVSNYVLPAACSYELLLMGALGFVGARARAWRVTLFGVLLLVPATFLAQSLYDDVARTDTVSFIVVLLIRAVLDLIPASIAHAVFAAFPKFPSKPGYCRECNYDLTGNVTGRCPECGAEIDRNVRASEDASA